MKTVSLMVVGAAAISLDTSPDFNSLPFGKKKAMLLSGELRNKDYCSDMCTSVKLDQNACANHCKSAADAVEAERVANPQRMGVQEFITWMENVAAECSKIIAGAVKSL